MRQFREASQNFENDMKEAMYNDFQGGNNMRKFLVGEDFIITSLYSYIALSILRLIRRFQVKRSITKAFQEASQNIKNDMKASMYNNERKHTHSYAECGVGYTNLQQKILRELFCSMFNVEGGRYVQETFLFAQKYKIKFIKD